MREVDEKLPPIFETFLTTCLDKFQVLVDEFGFEFIDYSVAGYECDVVYRKLPNVALAVTCEAGSTPFVMVTLAKAKGHRGNKHFEVSLDRLMKHRRKNWVRKDYDDPTDEQMKEVLCDYLKVLKEDLPELLCAKDDVGKNMRTLLGWKPDP